MDSLKWAEPASPWLKFPLFELLEQEITPMSIIVVLVILLLFFIISWLVQRLLIRPYAERYELEPGLQNITVRSIRLLLLITGAILGLEVIGIDAAGFANTVMQFEIFRVNQTPVSLFSILMLLAMIAAFAVSSSLVRRFVFDHFLSVVSIEQGIKYTFSRMIHYIMMIIGIVVAFQFIGINFSGLAVIFGFLSVGIGFGLQNITSNFISGLILLFERPIQVGDRVTVGAIVGDVEEISIRATKIRSEHNVSIIVPNSEFVSASVINHSHGDPKVLMDINVGVSYSSELETVLATLRAVAESNKDVLKRPAPQVHLSSFGDSSWDMQLRVWVSDPREQRRVRSELNCEIVRCFRENGVEIPFPQRDLHLRSPLPLPLAGEQKELEA